MEGLKQGAFEVSSTAEKVKSQLDPFATLCLEARADETK